MKKIIFLIVALTSMLACLFSGFDSSLFQTNEIEKNKIEEPKHQLIYDADYDFSEPLVASTRRYGNVNYDTVMFRDIICKKVKDSLKVEFGKGFFSSYANFTYTFKINIGLDSTNIFAARHSCTYYDEHNPTNSKVVLSNKNYNIGDSINLYFDITLNHIKKIDEYGIADTLKLKGAIKVLIRDFHFTYEDKFKENKALELIFLSKRRPDTTSLSLYDAGLDTIPNEIEKFTSLKILDLRKNNISISELEKLTKLQSLEILYINENNLKEFPSSILKLKNLQFLNISDNQLIYFPKELYEMQNLKELYIKGNKIKNLEAKVKKLKHLEKSDFTEE